MWSCTAIAGYPKGTRLKLGEAAHDLAGQLIVLIDTTEHHTVWRYAGSSKRWLTTHTEWRRMIRDATPSKR